MPLPPVGASAGIEATAIPAQPAVGDAQPLDPLAQARAAATRGDAPEALSRYLRVLATAPDDVAALTGAGQAALAVGDLNAATGFFGRAEARAPANGAIKAGIGATLVRQGDARGALRYFRAAVQEGVPETAVAADRGLAADLRGDPKRAQADYALALRARPGAPETVRRLALSQAIGGERAAALATLDPQLRQSDPAAWRARMFARALTGDVAGANQDAALLLAAPQAAALAPYLARLPALKPAEKAAAVFLGRFPPQRPTAASATVATAAPPASAFANVPLPPPVAAPTPSVDLGPLADVATVPSSPALKAIERRVATAARSAPAKPARPAPAPREPTRYWVQVAGGANKRDLPKAWAKLKAKWPRALGDRSPWTMHYRYTNRLLVGPFDSAGAAQAWVTTQRKAGLSAFSVTTPPGTLVERVGE